MQWLITVSKNTDPLKSIIPFEYTFDAHGRFLQKQYEYETLDITHKGGKLS